ncbi:centrosomal protein of 85 kDa-like isoform X2 [Oscarella lobularis]|uniref:centrosomal protein of 85 kDa-like isoform X2 n=1 Tax=Oscarella lobularis TaxID=121494 RepID=UPI0033133C6C
MRKSDRLLKSLSPRSGVKAAVSKPASGTKTNEEGLTSALACLAEKEKWEPLLRAKDNLLRQKDLVIERQRVTIDKMRTEVHLMEGELNRAYMANSQDDLWAVQIQEQQCEAAALKARLAELEIAKKREVKALSKTLGKTEVELQETVQTFKHDVIALKDKVEERDRACSILLEEKAFLERECNEIKGKLRDYESYVVKLPSQEENEALKEEVLKLRSEVDQLAAETSTLRKNLDKSQEDGETKNSEIQKLRDQISALLPEGAQARDSVIQTSSESLVALRVEAERDHLQKVLAEKEAQHQAQVEKLKRLFKKRHGDVVNKLKIQLQDVQRQEQMLRERLQQEEDTVSSMRLSVASAQEERSKSRASITMLTEHNQQLLEEVLTLKDQIKLRESEFDARAHKVSSLSSRLHGVTRACIKDMQAVVDCYLGYREGKEPDISKLLGVNSPIDDDDQEECEDLLAANQQLLDEMEEIRKDVDRVRTALSDKYAEDIGKNCRIQ